MHVDNLIVLLCGILILNCNDEGILILIMHNEYSATVELQILKYIIIDNLIVMFDGIFDWFVAMIKELLINVDQA